MNSFGSFIRGGKQYNCVYQEDSFKKGKGYKVRYDKTTPKIQNFFYATDTAYTKKILPFMK